MTMQTIIVDEGRESVLRFIGSKFDECRFGPNAHLFDPLAVSIEILEQIEHQAIAFCRDGFLIFQSPADLEDEFADPEGEVRWIGETKPTRDPDFIDEEEDTGVGAPPNGTEA